MSGVHYGQALQRLATAMADPVAMQRDEFLMVIWLLGLYEVRVNPVVCHFLNKSTVYKLTR